jgi:hypothetical protein
MGRGRKKPEMSCRCVAERKGEARDVIDKLSEMRLTTQYEAVRELMGSLKRYIDDGKRIEVDIPFPEVGRRIVGVLAVDHREEVWIKMEKDIME